MIGGATATPCPICHKVVFGGEALVEHMKNTHKDPNASGVASKFPNARSILHSDSKKETFLDSASVTLSLVLRTHLFRAMFGSIFKNFKFDLALNAEQMSLIVLSVVTGSLANVKLWQQRSGCVNILQ